MIFRQRPISARSRITDSDVLGARRDRVERARRDLREDEAETLLQGFVEGDFAKGLVVASPGVE